ncbi:MAG TPA: glycosyltransferase [Thermoanaerobaculia bacterium]|nr:glycosyltransferase [Thermoanaerobaculia bacterium]
MAGFAEYRNLHAGASVVVCGCGTSLSALTNPKRFVTIGVNDVGRLFDPDYLVVVNHRTQFSGDRFRYVAESRARALFTQLDLRISHPNVVHFRLGKRGGTDFADPSVLHYTRNSPYVAVCLAVHMGAKRIGLIGVDFTHDHFFAQTGAHPLQRELGQIDGEYGRLREACQRLGVELVNLSEGSRLASLPKMTVDEFAALREEERPLRLVSYATTPVAGVPSILARCIANATPHEARCVWETDRYGNGVAFRGDVEYGRSPAEAIRLLQAADAIVVHNGKVDARHRVYVDAKPVVTLAHNYAWNVDQRYMQKGYPGLVVGQYQATLPELAGWTAVPNPMPLDELVPGAKNAEVTIAYTPSGRHERYPESHKLYWHSKGYETTARVLKALAQRHGVRLEMIGAQQVTHAESLAMKQRAHIVIDECVTGSYHRNSLEGLAAGCVVVNGLGIRPEIETVFRACAPDSEEIPFVSARLETLEEALEGLIALGIEGLLERGARNRAWMERHWLFAPQWIRVWRPAIEQAMEQATVRAAKRVAAPPPALPVPLPVKAIPVPPPAPKRRDPLEDVTIVVPCGGEERLRNLRAVVDALRRAEVPHAILAESDTEPRAAAIAAEAGFRHVFVPREGSYHKARVMNEGAAAVTTGRFVWLDADLLVTRAFLEHAVAELEQQEVDALVPWTSCRYLSEADSAAVASGAVAPEACTPVNTYFTRGGCRGGVVAMRTEFVRQYGGVCEEFRGWGGEDNAFFHKVTVLGRAIATARTDQHIHHLWHPFSGGYGPPVAMSANPNYQKNVALMYEVRALRTRAQFLARFPAQPQSKADVLFLAWNRLEFTRESFALLLRNTEWDRVRELVVWDDGSTDGTKEWLREAVRRVSVPVRFVETELRSPVAAMARFIEEAQAPVVAKIDNDVLVPPQWLSESLEVLDAHPELSLLGIEAMQPLGPRGSKPRSYAPAKFVSGLALYRRSAFAASRPTPLGSWFGFEEWQRQQRPQLGTGWIAPALPVVLLDRVPFEPWASLTERYVDSGWQRRWPAYPESLSALWQWWAPAPRPAAPFDVVILSANPKNAVACVKAVLAQEPDLDPSHIIVVDDGARAEAEPQLPGVRWVEGEKPFIFARNANRGIAASTRDVVLLNDDALLTTREGFARLSRTANAAPQRGIVSAGIRGVVGNANQRVRGSHAVRSEGRMVCFIAVYLRRGVLDAVGPLDERFVGYGYEDDDYCHRVREAGYAIVVDDGCVVDHGTLRSSSRTRADYAQRFAQNKAIYEAKVSIRGPARANDVLCVMRVKNEGAHIGEVIERVLPLCGRVLVFDDHSDDDTAAVCRSFGERVRLLPSPFQGLDEARDKNYLLRFIGEEDPAWVLWIDGDEVLERTGAARLRAQLDATPPHVAVYSLRVAYVWDADGQVRVDGIWGRFRRPSLFRWRGQNLAALRFPEKKPPNFHCGNTPRGIAGTVQHCDVRLKHYGYAGPDLRQRKYVWYTTTDPNNAAEDNYRHLAEVAGARHAPGPPVFVPWTE